jgi:hypothetical protein
MFDYSIPMMFQTKWHWPGGISTVANPVTNPCLVLSWYVIEYETNTVVFRDRRIHKITATQATSVATVLDVGTAASAGFPPVHDSSLVVYDRSWLYLLRGAVELYSDIGRRHKNGFVPHEELRAQDGHWYDVKEHWFRVVGSEMPDFLGHI